MAGGGGGVVGDVGGGVEVVPVGFLGAGYEAVEVSSGKGDSTPGLQHGVTCKNESTWLQIVLDDFGSEDEVVGAAALAEDGFVDDAAGVDVESAGAKFFCGILGELDGGVGDVGAFTFEEAGEGATEAGADFEDFQRAPNLQGGELLLDPEAVGGGEGAVLGLAEDCCFSGEVGLVVERGDLAGRDIRLAKATLHTAEDVVAVLADVQPRRRGADAASWNQTGSG